MADYDTLTTGPLDLIAECVASIWNDCPTAPTHLVFRTDIAGQACHLRPVRRVERGYVLAEHGPEFDVEVWAGNTPWLPWDELERLVGQQKRHPALARESGGWWRLALHPLGDRAEWDIEQDYEAHAVVQSPDAGARDAARGKEILLSHLAAVRDGRRVEDVLAEHDGHDLAVGDGEGGDLRVLNEDDDPAEHAESLIECRSCQTDPSVQWERGGNTLAVGGPLIRVGHVVEAVVALLHYADGWHHASDVLERALLLLAERQQDVAFGVPEPTPVEEVDLRALDTVAGAVAAHYAAAVRFRQAAWQIADLAETRFRSQVEGRRFDTVRAWRAAAEAGTAQAA
ncbi:hypothetical protein GCM10010371_57240 [Streptomyces subrutilus]|uniref:Uncharacterized protein n=1 Tax=Streptomyces subrutilus TaxID=36818 RepID=A0A918R7J9_9ACTN|nr:hypothetical protein [Streptomyces subrutilus]GGZ89904.1 hypothetical protein GCM10010371_57240 [Streptomyces subrutilus]